MRNVKEFYFPQSLKEFSSVFNKNSYLIAGSVYSFKSWQKRTDVERVIFIDRLPLRYIRKKRSYVAIGALVTFDMMEDDKLLNSLFGGYLSLAASTCSSQLIRNMATIGGNIFHLVSFNIAPILVKTLNADIVVFDGKRNMTYSFDDFYKKKPFGLIKEVRFPLVYNDNYFFFEKLSKAENSWESYIIFSFRVAVKNGIIRDAALVFGGVQPLPFQDKEKERELLIGKKVSEIEFDLIANSFAQAIYSLNPSHHLSFYRKETTYAMVYDFLKRIKKEG